MTLSLYRDETYIGDLASNNGWEQFARWTPPNGPLAQLANTGTAPLQAVRGALRGKQTQTTAKHLRRLLRPLGGTGTLVVVDGVGGLPAAPQRPTGNHTPGGHPHDQRKHGNRKKRKPRFDTSILQLPVPKAVAGKVRGLKKLIPTKDRVRKPGGRWPHVTLLTGIKGETLDSIPDKMVGLNAPELELGSVEVFDTNPDWDVVVVKVKKTASLRKLRKHMMSIVKAKPLFPTYKPHLTVGFVKKGLGKKYAKKIGKKLNGLKFKPSEIQFSNPEAQKLGIVINSVAFNHKTAGLAHNADSCGAGTGRGGGFGKGNTCAKKGKGFGEGADVSEQQAALLKERKRLEDQLPDRKADAEFIQDQMQDAYEKFIETNDPDDWMESKERAEWHERYNNAWRDYWKVRDQVEEFDKELMLLPVEHIPTEEEFTGLNKKEGYFGGLSYEEAVEEYGDDGVSDILDRARKKRDDWRSRMKYELSMGNITQEQAEAKGWHTTGGYKYEEMPEDLWHVTTAASKVKKDGVLKTRDELKISEGPGLGGGASDTISYTADPKVATHIYGAMKEGRAVAAGEIDVPDMIKAAEEGVGTNGKPYIERLMHHWDRDWKTGDPLPERVQQTIDGKRRKWSTLKVRYEEARPATKKEQMDGRWEFFKRFAFTREHEGGPMDPLFFSTDIEKLGNTDPKDIRVMRLRSKPGAQGYQVSALGEWRSHTGDNVEVVDVGIDDIEDRLVKNLLHNHKQQKPKPRSRNGHRHKDLSLWWQVS